AGPAVAEGLGGDGRVVQEAVAAVAVGGGMVPGGPAEREDAARAALDPPLRRDGDVDGAPARPPGAGGDRRAGIEGVVAELAVDRFGDAVAAHAASRPGEGQGIDGPAARRPLLPG